MNAICFENADQGYQRGGRLRDRKGDAVASLAAGRFQHSRELIAQLVQFSVGETLIAQHDSDRVRAPFRLRRYPILQQVASLRNHLLRTGERQIRVLQFLARFVECLK